MVTLKEEMEKITTGSYLTMNTEEGQLRMISFLSQLIKEIEEKKAFIQEINFEPVTGFTFQTSYDTRFRILKITYRRIR